MIQKGICEECQGEYEYEYNPKFPRKYCYACSAQKKASYEAQGPKDAVQPVNVPATKPGEVEHLQTKYTFDAKQTKPNGHATMYTSYAKDIFCGFLSYKKEGMIKDEELMDVCIKLVKQAKEAFE